MTASKSNIVFQVLAFGLILAMIKLVYLFFDFNNILDFVVFASFCTLPIDCNKPWLFIKCKWCRNFLHSVFTCNP